MTREEEILSAAREYNEGVTLSSPSNVLHFEAGAKWADEHPKNIWHSASEEPIFHSDIVVIDKHNSWLDIQSYDNEDYDYNELCGGNPELSGWEACVENYEIVRWAYISDLLPKGGEK